jgi:hypothetical protein
MAGRHQNSGGFRATGGSVGSAVAPALSTAAAVIMLTPWRSTSFFGLNSMKNKVAALAAAIIRAIVIDTRSLSRRIVFLCLVRFPDVRFTTSIRFSAYDPYPSSLINSP